MSFPIPLTYLCVSSPADVEVEEDEEKEDKPKTKSVEKTTWDWELMNVNKPIYDSINPDLEPYQRLGFTLLVGKRVWDTLT